METKTPFIWHELVTTDQKKVVHFLLNCWVGLQKKLILENSVYTLYSKKDVRCKSITEM